MNNKFTTNRSVFLPAILRSFGLEESVSEESEEVYFSYRHPGGQGGTIDTFDSDLANVLDNKKSFFEQVRSSGLSGLLSSLPETFLCIREIEDAADDGSLWFLKHNTGTEGKQVWCYQNKIQLAKFIGVLETEKYIVQREVPNIACILGRKFTLRVYILVVKEVGHFRAFVHPRVLGKLHPRRYTRDSTHRDVHVECADEAKRIAFEGHEWSPYIEVEDRIHTLCADVATLFLRIGQTVKGGNKRYLLLGLDFLVSSTEGGMKPWVIEVNTFPYIYDNDHFAAELKKTVLHDMCALLIESKTGVWKQIVDATETLPTTS